MPSRCPNCGRCFFDGRGFIDLGERLRCGNCRAYMNKEFELKPGQTVFIRLKNHSNKEVSFKPAEFVRIAGKCAVVKVLTPMGLEEKKVLLTSVTPQEGK